MVKKKMEQKLKLVENCRKCEHYAMHCAFHHAIIWEWTLDHVVACSKFQPKKGNFFGLNLNQVDKFMTIHREDE